ncbi:alpha/beta hydrolase [Ammonicoccus fulvus]|uniref:Alpha/beta hydrolase n=1 Tax=Ammonicoccus fulvus TaxID=3138240 RepID=A0ABZ3FPY9_9ACTN
MADFDSASIDLTTGAKAHYAVAGPVDGPPVILLHGGLPGSSGAAGWRFMIPALAERGFRVYAPDRPGFGKADARPQHWPVRGILSWAEFMEDFVNALGLDTFFLAGNSQGAQVAATYAVRNPERVERMILIASGGFNAVLDIPADQLTKGIPFPQWEGTVESMRSMLESIVYRTESLDDDLIKLRCDAAEIQREAYAAAGAWNRRAMTDPTYRQAHRLTGHLDQLQIPILYLYGKQDVLGPVENAYLQEDRLPNVQFFYPDECGHQGQTDQPEMHHEVFGEFFATGQVSRKLADWAGISTRRPELPGIVAD